MDINYNVKSKLNDIIYFETEGKKRILDNINITKKEIINKTNITSIEVTESSGGYYINYTIENTYKHEIFCYTLSEVCIHLKYLRYGNKGVD